jgi:GNAT superfamily N-acetyltransferase
MFAFIEQNRDQLASATAAFPGRRPQLALASIIAGHTDGRLWRYAPLDAPPFYILWDQGNNVFYLAGEQLDADGQTAATEFLRRQIAPLAVAEELAYFKAQAQPPLAPKLPPALWPDLSLRAMRSLLFVFDGERPSAVPATTLPDLQLVPIDRALLAQDDLINGDYLREEIGWMWPSLDHFYAHGLGWAAQVGDRLICWCTAEYMSGDRCGIGIATHPDFRQKGVATAVTVRFIQSCLDKGLQPHWECDQENLSSVRVAEKAGFTRVAAELFWAGQFAA